MSKNINYVPKRKVKEYKKDMHAYLLMVQNNLKESGKPYFDVGIVGSAKRNLILRRGNEIYSRTPQRWSHYNILVTPRIKS